MVKCLFLVGVLNSAVLTPDRATAKEFMLKDDTGVIKCIFYQIVSTQDKYMSTIEIVKLSQHCL